MTFIPVTNITLTPDLTQLISGQASTHTAMVAPSNATNKNINWSRLSGVNATISQNTSGSELTITPQATGSIEVQATIANGKLQ